MFCVLLSFSLFLLSFRRQNYAAEIRAVQPWRCLCEGALEQITMTLPWRLITLHLSHIGFTEGLTFIFVYTPCRSLY
jgi:hypothetical protein